MKNPLILLIFFVFPQFLFSQTIEGTTLTVPMDYYTTKEIV